MGFHFCDAEWASRSRDRTGYQTGLNLVSSSVTNTTQLIATQRVRVVCGNANPTAAVVNTKVVESFVVYIRKSVRCGEPASHHTTCCDVNIIV